MNGMDRMGRNIVTRAGKSNDDAPVGGDSLS
jgi:hypothetical protein